MAECIAIDELHGPIQQPDDAPQTAEGNASDDISIRRFLLLCDTDGLSQQVDERYHQGTEADAAE